MNYREQIQKIDSEIDLLCEKSNELFLAKRELEQEQRKIVRKIIKEEGLLRSLPRPWVIKYYYHSPCFFLELNKLTYVDKGIKNLLKLLESIGVDEHEIFEINDNIVLRIGTQQLTIEEKNDKDMDKLVEFINEYEITINIQEKDKLRDTCLDIVKYLKQVKMG